jgi:hypothetical protein
MTDPASDTIYVDECRNHPQGELFFMKGEPGALEALVYNTIGLNRCPEDTFEAIDVEKLKEETGSLLVWKNPRRFWMMDHLTIAKAGEPHDWDGLAFNFVADMKMPPGFTPAGGQQEQAYKPTQIHRRSRYEFLAGRPVFLLRSPEMTWVLQTYTNHIATDLTEHDLLTLGDRLDLADGWEFRAHRLDRDLVLDTNGLAHIVPDNLANMYQGCTPEVANFDPWE